MTTHIYLVGQSTSVVGLLPLYVAEPVLYMCICNSKIELKNYIVVIVDKTDLKNRYKQIKPYWTNCQPDDCRIISLIMPKTLKCIQFTFCFEMRSIMFSILSRSNSCMCSLAHSPHGMGIKRG